MWDGHINLDICTSEIANKYMFKYIMKGQMFQNAMISTNDDEVEAIQRCRYLSAAFCLWVFLGFTMYSRDPTVVMISVHMQDEENVVLREDDAVDVILTKANNTTSTLLQYFARPSEAVSLLYSEYHEQYTVHPKKPSNFVPTNNSWKKDTKGMWVRRRGPNQVVVARLQFVQPNLGEKHALRLMLLHHAADSFDALLFGHSCYYEAAIGKGLLNDHIEYLRAFN
jgi:hypothetical protein